MSCDIGIFILRFNYSLTQFMYKVTNVIIPCAEPRFLGENGVLREDYPKCFIASRRLNGWSGVALTNFFTALGSVRAY